MSKTISIFGTDVDHFCCYGDTLSELDCSNPKFHLQSEDGEMMVVGHFGNGIPGGKGTWIIGVTLVRPGIPIPSWPMRFETAPVPHNSSAKSFSPILRIEAPDDVQVTPRCFP